jgi:hypothetical protein
MAKGGKKGKGAKGAKGKGRSKSPGKGGGKSPRAARGEPGGEAQLSAAAAAEVCEWAEQEWQKAQLHAEQKNSTLEQHAVDLRLQEAAAAPWKGKGETSLEEFRERRAIGLARARAITQGLAAKEGSVSIVRDAPRLARTHASSHNTPCGLRLACNRMPRCHDDGSLRLLHSLHVCFISVCRPLSLVLDPRLTLVRCIVCGAGCLCAAALAAQQARVSGGAAALGVQ